MYSRSKLALKYLQYYLTASNGKGHGIHSPFIFHFVTWVLNDRKQYSEYDQVETLRKQLLKDQTILTVEDYGAGSVSSKTKERNISSIAKNAAKPKKYGQLLFRMVKEYQPETILELGTSLGLTSSYLSLARPGSAMITMEGAKEVAAVARKNMDSLGIKNAKIIEGNFDDKLAAVVNELPSFGLAFIDGNHRREPTERYFHELLPKTNDQSIMVFDDIHWSREMEEAWQSIKDHSSVCCSIDLFFIGIILFRKEFREKQHFVIRF
jgi:predicted O-methyltransferase YrrM